MARSQDAARIEKLRAEIRRHDYLYYVLDRPKIADAAYDRLFRRLQELETAHPELVSPDSPTQRVAGAVLEKFASARHAAPMLSLDSSSDPEALLRFDERLRKALGKEALDYVVEPKLDGVSLEVVYEEGVLVRAATRGDGVTGEDVSANARTIASVPLRLRTADLAAPRRLALRGEVMLHVADFEQLNEGLIAAGEEPFANPRNFAAGTLRQLDSRTTAARPLVFYAYDILAVEGWQGASQWQVFEDLRKWGVVPCPRARRVSGVEEIRAYHRELGEARDDLEFEIDGVVVKLDDFEAREDLGSTARHPRWAFAFKFPPRKEITRVEKILASVGRTGVVTPVAMLLPVEIGGVTVARASLHNREEVARKDIREGDRVRIERAGDVIPYVVERIDEPGHRRGAPFRMPRDCPSCGTPLIERGPFTVCPNGWVCRAQLVGRIVHFASRQALDIEGLGEETAKQLVAEGLVRELPDVFGLAAERLMPLAGFAEKSATQLVAAIAKGRHTSLERFLNALGIPEVGVAVARDLARHFGDLDALRRASEATLQEIPGVGPRMAEAITAFFADARNRKLLGRLAPLFRLQRPPRVVASGALTGKKFVFTGGLSALPREEAKRLVESLGAKVSGSVSKATDYVVVGEDPGSKADDAGRLAVKILEEAEFVALLRQCGVDIG
jgi:DNA ligase (NAD+)